VNEFPSKIDWWLGALLGGSAVPVGVAAFRAFLAPAEGGPIVALVLLLIGCGLPLWVLSSTKYTIAAPLLLVRSGPFRWKIPLAEITKVTPTRNPLSSPALSLDRLRIEYGRGRVCMISPREKDAFLRELREKGASAV
jgi:hypothetical protein